MIALQSEKAGKDSSDRRMLGVDGWGVTQRQVAAGVKPRCERGQAVGALWGISLS